MFLSVWLGTMPWLCYRRRNQWLRLALASFCLPLTWLARVVTMPHIQFMPQFSFSPTTFSSVHTSSCHAMPTFSSVPLRCSTLPPGRSNMLYHTMPCHTCTFSPTTFSSVHTSSCHAMPTFSSVPLRCSTLPPGRSNVLYHAMPCHTCTFSPTTFSSVVIYLPQFSSVRSVQFNPCSVQSHFTCFVQFSSCVGGWVS